MKPEERVCRWRDAFVLLDVQTVTRAVTSRDVLTPRIPLVAVLIHAHGLVQASDDYGGPYLFPWGFLTPEGLLIAEASG